MPCHTNFAPSESSAKCTLNILLHHILILFALKNAEKQYNLSGTQTEPNLLQQTLAVVCLLVVSFFFSEAQMLLVVECVDTFNVLAK